MTGYRIGRLLLARLEAGEAVPRPQPRREAR